ncbi:anti-repressor SinI family protein [Bacillus sp. DJP31]|uniref:anti-repressor SinI family protein n=1 Tax=Bacillus sp. DJP31 TaxID=3409789 RepID=UPI003BB4E4BE
MRNVNQKQSDYINLEELDQEWVELISEAISMGLTKDEIRNFLLNNGRIMNLGQLARTV